MKNIFVLWYSKKKEEKKRKEKNWIEKLCNISKQKRNYLTIKNI